MKRVLVTMTLISTLASATLFDMISPMTCEAAKDHVLKETELRDTYDKTVQKKVTTQLLRIVINAKYRCKGEEREALGIRADALRKELEGM